MDQWMVPTAACRLDADSAEIGRLARRAGRRRKTRRKEGERRREAQPRPRPRPRPRLFTGKGGKEGEIEEIERSLMWEGIECRE